MPRDKRYPHQREPLRKKIPGRLRGAFLSPKASLNEEDFPLFTHRRGPIGERRSSLALRSGWQGAPPGFFLLPQ